MLRVASAEQEGETSHFSRVSGRPSNKQSPKSDGTRNINSKYRIDELNEPAPRLQGIRSLLPLPGGDLLTGGTDLKIRYWDHTRFSFKSNLFFLFQCEIDFFKKKMFFFFMICSPERSYCVCGPSTKGVGNDGYYDIRSSFGVQVVQVILRFMLFLFASFLDISLVLFVHQRLCTSILCSLLYLDE